MPTISIDFDGVIHDYSDGWTGYHPIGEPVPGSLEFVQECIDVGYVVFISSCRAFTQTGRECIKVWLEDNGFPIGRIHITSDKPHADWYIDDRAIRFEGDFNQVKE